MSKGADGENYSLRALLRLALRCWPYYRPQLRHILTFVILNALSGVLILGFGFLANDLVENKILLGERLQPMQAKIIVVGDEFVTSGEGDEVLLTSEQRQRVRQGTVILGALCWIMFIVYMRAMWYYMVWIFQRVNQQLRVEMLRRAEQLSLGYHSHSRTGDAIYRVYQDSATITNILQFLILSPLRIVVWVCFSAVVLLFFSPWFGLIFLLAAVAITFMMRTSLPIVRQKARLARENNSDLTSRIQESLTAIRVIKANGAEGRMMDRFRTDSQQALDSAYEMRFHISLLMMGTLIVALGGFLVAEYFMATWAMSEKATYLGGTVAFVGFAFWNLGAFKAATSQAETSAFQVWELAYTMSFVQDLAVGLKRAFYLLDIEPEVRNPVEPKAFPSELRSVRFDKVTFGYEPGQIILKQVDLSAEAGTVTAIVGSTGSGKSTLMSLLLRLYDPVEGSVLFNSIPLSDMAVDDIRSNVAIALQQNVLFAKSVEENIRYGRKDVSPSEVVRAAQIACADEFIAQMPNGYDTELGERGGKLSTGQRQRLSIARAVLRDTPVLILDEPTASLDAETERKVISNLAQWGRDRVVFIITHRLSTIRSADIIAFLEDGEIKEIGGHEELMKCGGAYSNFVQAESGDTYSGGGDD